MKILMVTSEAVPWAKTGGLADMVSALSINLAKMGHDVRIVLPRYYSIDRTKLELIPGGMGTPMGSGIEEWSAIYTTDMPGTSKKNPEGNLRTLCSAEFPAILFRWSRALSLVCKDK